MTSFLKFQSLINYICGDICEVTFFLKSNYQF